MTEQCQVQQQVAYFDFHTTSSSENTETAEISNDHILTFFGILLGLALSSRDSVIH